MRHRPLILVDVVRARNYESLSVRDPFSYIILPLSDYTFTNAWICISRVCGAGVDFVDLVNGAFRPGENTFETFGRREFSVQLG